MSSRGRRPTLVAAPAGIGKTTRLSEWIHDEGRAHRLPAVAWVSFDEGDSDLARLFAYIVAALQTIGEAVGQAMQGLPDSPWLLPIKSPITGLNREIAAIGRPLILP